MTLYLVLAFAGLVGGFLSLFQLADQLNADPQASLIDVVSSSTGSPLARGIAISAVLAGIAFLTWLVHEANSLSMRRSWIYIVLFFTTPFGFVAPLFLFMRELELARLGWD